MSTITKPPSTKARAFLAAAPDARTEPSAARLKMEETVQINLTLPKPMLQRLDALVKARGQTRASIIRDGINLMLRDSL